MDRTLGQVEEDCAYGAPEAQDTEAAQALIFMMSDSFVSEEDRRDAFSYWASEKFKLYFARHSTDKMETDGSAFIHIRHGVVIGANMEVRQDMGQGGGDPRLKNCVCAALHYSDAHRKPLRDMCRCPVLLMELAGPNLSLSGFTFGEHACSDQLSQTVSLLWQPNSELMIGAARVAYAIRRAWPALQVQL